MRLIIMHAQRQPERKYPHGYRHTGLLNKNYSSKRLGSSKTRKSREIIPHSIVIKNLNTKCNIESGIGVWNSNRIQL